ncbi:hypothetical protein [Caldisphaera sp.]|uniref:hypothetical protein n=1 Tax=Caldisphaera sp. TaxID=2060322 RepID=UPI003D1327B4
MKEFKGILVFGEIGGQGTPYLYSPWYDDCLVREEDGIFIFYVNGKEILRSRYLSGQTWEGEYDDFGNINYTGYYWEFYSVDEWRFIINNVIGENESIQDWLKEKYEGWGI